MQADTVSVVMPSYNSERFIAEAIRSVIGQTYERWELLIVDDCSSDNTYQVASAFAALDSRIVVMRQPVRGGAAKARNRAIAAAKGRFVAFLDSDDAWLPQKLAKQLPEMQRHDAVLSYTAYKKMDAHGTHARGVVQVPRTVTYSQLLNTCVIGCLTAVYDSAKIGKVFMPNIARRQDYGLWLRILKGKDQANFQSNLAANAPVAIGINEPLAVYRVHDHGLSRNKLKAAYYQWQVYRRCEKLSIVRCLYHFLQYARHGYRKSRIA